MTIKDEVRQAIITDYSDHTIADLSKTHNISTSSVQRIIREGKKQQADIKEKAGSGAGANEEVKTDGPQSAFTYTPDAALDSKEQFEIGDGDGSMSSLLKGLKDEDPFQSLTGIDEGAVGAAVDASTVPADAPAPPTDDMFAQMTPADQGELDNLIQGLLSEPEAPKAKKRGKKATAMTTRPQQPPPSPVQQQQQPASVKAILPVQILRTQASLYIEHMSHLVHPVTGKSESEQKAFIKSISKMDRETVTNVLCSLKGCVVISNSCNMIKNGVHMGCGLVEQFSPYLDMNTSGLSDAMRQQNDELEQIALEMAISDFDWYASQATPRARLGTLLLSTTLQVHNRNQALASQHAQQEVDQATMEKYQNM